MFARKLLRPVGQFTKADLENELRAVNKLCQPGAHINIVSTLNYGKMKMSSYHFLDMELCDFNLASHISKWHERTTRTTVDNHHRLTEIGKIMMDILNGITFIHQQGEIHRDLKPRNSKI